MQHRGFHKLDSLWVTTHKTLDVPLIWFFHIIRNCLKISFNGSNWLTWGADNISKLHEQNFPSVETLMRLWAFWVPTTFTLYTGCWELKTSKSIQILTRRNEKLWMTVLTVCAAAVRGLLWTGVRLLLRLSQSTIWPEYVPPIIKLGWNLANVADITADCNKTCYLVPLQRNLHYKKKRTDRTWQWKIYSGVVFLNFMFQISATPSGSCGDSSLLL